MIKRVLLGCLLSLCWMLAPAADAANLDVSGDVGVGLVSSYIWRGREYSDKAIVQPEVGVRIDRWMLNARGMWDLEGGDPDSTERTRADLMLDYGIPWNDLQFKVGAIARIFHDDPGGKASDTYEVFAQVVANTMLCPSLTLYYDFGNIEGVYASVGLGDTTRLCEWADAVLNVQVGMGNARFNRDFFGNPDADEGEEFLTEKNALVDFSGSLAFPMTYREVVLTPKVEYIALLDSDLRDAAKAAGREASRVVGSITATWEF